MKNKRENKRTVCFFFHIHQPFRLKTYRFFNVGIDHNYFDDENNKNIIKRISKNCYLPANEVLMHLIRKLGNDFKVTLGISGTALEQFKKYVPQVIDSFHKLYQTGNIEFVAESYANSLAILNHPDEYKRQVKQHLRTIKNLFGCNPTAFINANLLYADGTSEFAHQMGFKTILTEGAKQALDWRSANYPYSCNPYHDIKLLLRNYQLSDDISFRFSMHNWNQWPLTPDKYISWLDAINEDQKLINLFMDYGTLGESQNKDNGILRFVEAFCEKIIATGKWTFRTVTEAAESAESIESLNIPEYISWADQDRNLSAWLGNELQQEAYSSLYSVAYIMGNCIDSKLLSDWTKLQTCDHFYYMSTKYLNDGDMYRFFSPYSSPYEAFLNYMNVLSDFLIQVDEYAAHKAFKDLMHQEYDQEQNNLHEQYQLLTM